MKRHCFCALIRMQRMISTPQYKGLKRFVGPTGFLSLLRVAGTAWLRVSDSASRWTVEQVTREMGVLPRLSVSCFLGFPVVST